MRQINALEIGDFGKSCHTACSEPYFYDSSYVHDKVNGPVPIDLSGRAVVSPEIGERDSVSDRPTKWSCTTQCKLPSSEERESIEQAKAIFKLPVQQVREKLEGLDSGCENGHTMGLVDSPADENELCRQLMGHPLSCTTGMCSSQLRILRAASAHYPVLRQFLWLIYVCRKQHRAVFSVDHALCTADFDQLMQLSDVSEVTDLFGSDLDEESSCEDCSVIPDNSVEGLPNLEQELQVKHAGLITKYEKGLSDDPEHACCSCERLEL